MCEVDIEDGTYLDFSKTLGTVFHEVLLLN